MLMSSCMISFVQWHERSPSSVNIVACGGPTLPTSPTFLPVLPQPTPGPGTVHMSTLGMDLSPCDYVLPTNNVRSGLADLVREVKRKSLRRRKLWTNPDTDLQIAECDQNKNFGPFTPSEFYLHLFSEFINIFYCSSKK